jgi:hypothetical protein
MANTNQTNICAAQDPLPISRAPSEESDSTEQGDRSPSPNHNTMKHGYTREEEEDRKLRDDRPIEFSAQVRLHPRV